MHTKLNTFLQKILPAKGYQSLETIQSLWSGYGKIERIAVLGGEPETVVVKSILLDQPDMHPRGWGSDRSHLRKVKSYQIENHWYEQWSQRCSSDCKVPVFLGAFQEGNNQWIVMEDLDAKFPQRNSAVSLDEVKVCLQWLAHFHATFMGARPTGLWEIGTYWHLDTRPDEWEKIENLELKDKAASIDAALNVCRYQTIVHGDAKLANFCFAEDGGDVAVVDFQYVGGGCGMKDVAYFLGSCMSGDQCRLYEVELLDYYFLQLQHALETSHLNVMDKPVDFPDLEQEWRKMYPLAWTDFTRFMLGWMPTHQKIHGYSLHLMHQVLGGLE